MYYNKIKEYGCSFDKGNKTNINVRTHVTELLVDFACLRVHLHVREADPLVQILAVMDSTDGGLGVAGRQDL